MISATSFGCENISQCDPDAIPLAIHEVPTATPVFDDAAREGDLVRMPDWSAWPGPTIAVGQPGALFLLAPASIASPLSESWRLVRRVQPDATRP